MSDNDLCYLSAFELARAIRAKSVSPVEATLAVLDRVEKLNPKLNAFCTLMAESAMLEARQAEGAVKSSETLGPLHGVPISIKDNIYVKDSRTTFGSKLLEDQITRADAPIVERLRQAGAIIIGRTNTPEFGWKGVTDNLVFGATRNPWNLELTPGGSSGGASAAVASGLGPIGIGTAGGGSLRIPASFCGLVGHKPSYGRVPHYPGISVGSLRHIGGITRTVRDSALLLNVTAGPDERDASSLPASDVDFVAELDRGIEQNRVAYSPDMGYAIVDKQVAAACEQAASRLSDAGAEVERVDLDWSDPYDCWSVFFYGGATARLGEEILERGHLLDPGLRQVVEHGLTLTATDFRKARVQRDAFCQQVRALFKCFDLLVTPTLAVLPFPIGKDNADPFPEQPQKDLQWTQFTYPFNLTGQPVTSVPAGWTANNLPIGLQIIGRGFDDDSTLRAARAIEHLQPWDHRRPSLG